MSHSAEIPTAVPPFSANAGLADADDNAQAVAIPTPAASPIALAADYPDFRETRYSPTEQSLRSIGSYASFFINVVGMISAGLAAAVLFNAFLEGPMGPDAALTIAVLIGFSAYVGKVPILHHWTEPNFIAFLLSAYKFLETMHTQGIYYATVGYLGWTNVNSPAPAQPKKISAVSVIRNVLAWLEWVAIIGTNLLSPAIYAYLVYASAIQMAKVTWSFNPSVAAAFANPWFWGILMASIIPPNVFAPPGIMRFGRVCGALMLQGLGAAREEIANYLEAQARLNYSRNRLTMQVTSLTQAEDLQAFKEVLKILGTLIKNGATDAFENKATAITYCNEVSTLANSEELLPRLKAVLQIIKANEDAHRLAEGETSPRLDFESGLIAYATSANGFSDPGFSHLAARLRVIGQIFVAGISAAGLSNLLPAAINMMQAVLIDAAISQDPKDNIARTVAAFAAPLIAAMSAFTFKWGDGSVRVSIEALNYLIRSAIIPSLQGLRILGSDIDASLFVLHMPETPASIKLLPSWQRGMIATTALLICAAGGGYNAWVAFIEANQGAVITTAAGLVSFWLEFPAFFDLCIGALELRIINRGFKDADPQRQTVMSLLTLVQTRMMALGELSAPAAARVTRLLNCLKERNEVAAIKATTEVTAAREAGRPPEDGDSAVVVGFTARNGDDDALPWLASTASAAGANPLEAPPSPA